MPLIKRAIKKLAADRKRTRRQESVRAKLQALVKSMRRNPTKKALAAVYKALDKAAKRNIIHPNKAARLKSRLSRLLLKK